jgi:hypothetical protein
MIGIFNKTLSWEKQSVYDLDNGWQATTEYSSFYGGMISRLDSPNKQLLPNGKSYWHCSDGIDHLPAFAKPWLTGGKFHTTADIVRVGFTKQHSHSSTKVE